MRTEIITVLGLVSSILLVTSSHAKQEISSAQRLALSQRIVNDYQQSLKSALHQALAQGGAAKAVAVCAQVAPTLASQLSKQHGVTLQRVSANNRNPNNAPSQEQHQVLAYFAANPEQNGTVFQTLEDGSQLYAKAITVQEPCLACHGKQLSSAVKSALSENYPEDKARGYDTGDLRGMFSVTWPPVQQTNLKSSNFKMVSNTLWVSGQPSAEDFTELRELGITTIINLRTQQEMSFDEAAVAKQHNMSYKALPIDGKEAVTVDNARQLATILSQTEGKVLLHCASANRVGALLALAANENGVALEDALILGRFSGMTILEDKVKGQLKPPMKTQK